MYTAWNKLLNINFNEKIMVLSLLTFFSLFVMNLSATVKGGAKNLLDGDVSYYYAMYIALKNGTFDSQVFSYGIGFPLMGFLGSFQGNPFILFSMFLFVIVSYRFYLVLREFFSFNITLISLLIILATTPFTTYYIHSQNIIITATITIYLSSLLIRNGNLTIGSSGMLGFLFGLDFSSRYIDPILLLPMLFYIFIYSYKLDKKKFFLNVTAFSLLSIPWVVITLYFQKRYLGGYLITPYAEHFPYVDRIGSGSEDIFTHMGYHYFNNVIRNLYQVFIDPHAYALSQDIANEKSLLRYMPYLVFVFIGIYYWIKYKKPKPIALIYFAFTFLVMIIFYSSFWAFTAHDLKYGCLRYLSGWYPIMGAFSLFGIKSLYNNIKEKEGNTLLKYIFLLCIVHLIIFSLIKSIPAIDNRYINYLSYPRENWSIKSNKNQQDTAKMIDSDLTTRWSTESSMEKGNYIVIDTNGVSKFSQIRFDLRDKVEDDFPWRLEVFYSLDGEKYEKVKNIRSGRQNHVWTMDFPTLKARTFKIEIRQGNRNEKSFYWWSIYELNLLR